MRWHPDKNQDDLGESKLKFLAVAHAYEIVGNQEKRKVYDRNEGTRLRRSEANGDDQHFEDEPFDMFTMTMMHHGFESRLDNARNFQCTTAKEGYPIQLMCLPRARIVSVSFASYGNPTGSCSSSGTHKFQRGDCHAPNSQFIIEQSCVGQHSCSLTISNDLFSEPCPGTRPFFVYDDHVLSALSCETVLGL